MSSFRILGPFSLFTDHDGKNNDDGTLCRSRSTVPGTVDPVWDKSEYSYSISGATGALGSMLFTEAMRIPGIWYDRLDRTTALRNNEAQLGMSKYADKDFRKSAEQTLRNIEAPPKVDANIHFTTKDRIENITVRGRRGTQSFRFDLNAVEANEKNMPKHADPFKPFMDTINRILAAVLQVR